MPGLRFFLPLLLITAPMVWLSSCVQPLPQAATTSHTANAAAASEEQSVTFFLRPTGEQIIVPKRLQKILADRFSNPENKKRFTKTALRVIGEFHMNGKTWRWSGCRLHSSTEGYYYVPELDFPRKSYLGTYIRPYAQRSPKYVPYRDLPTDTHRLKKEVKRHFSAYE